MLSKTCLFQASHIVQRQMVTFPCCYFLLTKWIAPGVKDVRRFLTVYPQDIWILFSLVELQSKLRRCFLICTAEVTCIVGHNYLFFQQN